MRLDSAAVCADLTEPRCEEVFDVAIHHRCPKCGSTTYFLIAKALNRERLRFESERVIHDQEEFPVAAI